jgi:hypothetical protein
MTRSLGIFAERDPTLWVVNVAVTVVSAVTVTLQVPVPEQPPPDQPEKVESELAEAERVMLVPEEMEDWEQVEPQEMEPPVTVPEPVPDLDTVRV